MQQLRRNLDIARIPRHLGVAQPLGKCFGNICSGLSNRCSRRNSEKLSQVFDVAIAQCAKNLKKALDGERNAGLVNGTSRNGNLPTITDDQLGGIDFDIAGIPTAKGLIVQTTGKSIDRSATDFNRLRCIDDDITPLTAQI